MTRKPGYRAGVDTALHGSGLPYGFTLTIWGSGQVLIHHHGPPGIGLVFLFALGAVASWGGLRVLSQGASNATGLQLEASPHLVRAGVLHVTAIGAAIGAAALVGNIDSDVAWPLGAFAAVTVYLCVSAVELTLREREEEAVA
jgi:hypothetical protein